MSLANTTIQMAVQLELPLDYPGETRSAQRSELVNAAGRGTGHSGSNDCLMQAIVARGNVERAMQRVRQNQGSPGVDGMEVEELPAYMRHGWEYTREQLLAGEYQPSPIRRQAIPKAGGGERILGIPTVVDRVIQQAILQVLQPIFDAQFSQFSYGFRPQRSAHDAVRQAKQYVQDGRSGVVDVDLEKFFDRVNHDVLMGKLAARLDDKILLGLIRRYLGAGMLCDGVASERHEGTPQGGPLSPLLSNIMLNDLDRELEERGHKFVRYADDCNIYVKTERAGERVLKSVKQYLEKKLKLKVNPKKSKVERATRAKFLGFSFWKRKGEVFIRLANRTKERFAEKIRRLTKRTRSGKMEDIVSEVNRYTRGWIGYFGLATTPSVYQGLDEWIRRRLRQIQWKRWKRGTTRYRELVRLGVPKERAARGAVGASPWRMSHSPIIHEALNNAFWRSAGLESITERYNQLRYSH